MEQTIGRPRVARTYAWLITLSALVVVVQGFLFSGFYSEGEKGYIDTHGILGELAGYVVVIMIPLAFLARFPRHLRIGWLTVLLAVLWNVQAHLLGYGIEEWSWFEMIHIPTAFLILALALYLTGRAHKALKGRFD